MSDRRRLLTLSVLIVAVASIASTTVAIFQVAAALQTGPRTSFGFAKVAPEMRDSYRRAVQLSIAESAVIIIAGGTLLLRASNPFMRRLEASEARTRAILNTAGDGIITIDEQGTIESFNLASERMFGLPANETIGQPIGRLIRRAGDCDSNRTSADVLTALLTGDRVEGCRDDGRAFPLEHSLSRTCWDQRPMYTVILRDVTERMVAERQMREHVLVLHETKERLEAKAAELAKINRELDDFTYIASHDLKEPLRGISSYCQILLEDYGDKLDSEGRRRLESLVTLCARLGQLIDDLLAYSQIGRTQPVQQVTDLHEAASDVIATLGPAIERRAASVEIIGTLPLVTADRTLLGEVFSNLIANGLKFNESLRPRVEIGRLDTKPLTIYIRDNGIGIPDEHREAIFTMFRRLHNRRKYEGTGAGLTMVRKIIEAHGGRVWLESEPGVGSTFYFTLSPGIVCAHENQAHCAVS